MKQVISEFEVIHVPGESEMTLTFSFTKAEFGEFLSQVEPLPDVTPEYDIHEQDDLHVHFQDAVTLVFEGAGQTIQGSQFMLLGTVPHQFKDEDQVVVTLLINPSPELSNKR